MIPNLTSGNVTLPKEKTYFALVLTFSILVWLLLIVTIVGVFYAVLIGIFLWFANGLLIAGLKAEAVEVTETQLARLHAVWREVCDQLGLTELPRLYVVQAGGTLNAFATRFSGRNFVVLYSDMVEAYGEDSAEVRFVLGHEVGHISRNHMVKKLFIFPGLLLPLLGSAYSRACETSCDRFGALAAQDVNGATGAMMKLAGGKEAGRHMSAPDFARQYKQERGFFVSWYELISGYPTLSQRVANLLALGDGREPAAAPRHPLAYPFALFSLGGRAGGGVNLLVTIAIIAILMGVAVPAFSGAQKRAMEARAAQQYEAAGDMDEPAVDGEE